METAIDELAERLGIDPLALRERMDPSPVRREDGESAQKKMGWSRRHAPGADSGPIKRGIGMAQSLWGANVQTASFIEVRILRDGSVEARSSVQHRLGHRRRHRPDDRRDARPQAGRDQGAHRRRALSAGPAVLRQPHDRLDHASCARAAAWKLLQQLFAGAALALNTAPSDLVARDGRIETRTEPKRGMSLAEAAALMKGDMLSVTEARSEDYGGFRRTMGEAAQAQQDLGGVQFAEVDEKRASRHRLH